MKSDLRILIRAPEVPFLVPPKQPKTPKMTHFGRFGGYQKWYLGCPNQNSKTTFQYKYPPKTPTYTLWEPFWTPEKRFLAILLILVIFPLKFALKPKIFTANGRKCPTAKTKTVLESVNKMEQLVGMSKSKFRNSLK